jgi:parvulin-like peptidyl-prolyl isomerase
MFERVRELISSLTDRSDDGRFVSRAAREDRQRRILIIATAAVALGVIVALAAGAIWQYILVPRESYASVNGVEIRRTDYEKRRIYELLQQVTSLSQQLQSATQDQQVTMQQQLGALQLELDDLESGNKNINPDSLQSMIQDQLVLQGLDDFGIILTDEEVDDYVEQLLAPVPLTEPTPTFTIPPTAAAWATETVDAFYEQSTATSEGLATEAAGTATAAAEVTPEVDATASPDGTADNVEATPDVQATSDAFATEAANAPTATPDPNATATFTPVPTLEPTATPNREEAIATSDASFELLNRNFLDRAGMSRGDFKRLVVRPQLARQKISAALIEDIPPSQEQVRASHILLATRDAAVELIDTRLSAGEDFATVAKEVSTDTSSAVNGGDLGWFSRGVMTTPFEEAAFSLKVGEISEPIQTQFGWHIILVTDREENRPLTLTTLRSVQQNALSRWIDEQQTTASISAKVPLPDDSQSTNLVGQ